MPATKERIFLCTNDGTAISKAMPALKTQWNAAIDDKAEKESFFEFVADGQWAADEEFAWRGRGARPHEGVEVADSLGLGTTVAITPFAPKMTIIDKSRGINAVCTIVGYAYDGTSDRYSVELLG